MSSKKEMRNGIARVIHQHRLDGFSSGELADAILDVMDPWIREDERAKMLDVTVRVTGEIQERGRVLGREEMLAELRTELVNAPLHYREVPAMTISELIMILDRVEEKERA